MLQQRGAETFEILGCSMTLPLKQIQQWEKHTKRSIENSFMFFTLNCLFLIIAKDKGSNKKGLSSHPKCENLIGKRKEQPTRGNTSFFLRRLWPTEIVVPSMESVPVVLVAPT